MTCIEADGFTVRNSVSRFAGSGVLAVRNCGNILFENNKLYDGKEHGVDIVDGSRKAVVRNNEIHRMAMTAMVFDDHDWKCANCGDNPTEAVSYTHLTLPTICSV